MADTPRPKPQPFTEWFSKHAQGSVDQELAEHIADVTEAVLALEKKGTVTLTLTFEKIGGNALAVIGEVKSKAPEAPQASIFFRDDTGSLFKDDPGAWTHQTDDGAEKENPAMQVETEGGLALVDPESGEVVRRVGNDG